MHHGKNKDSIRFDAVQNAIWKTIYKAAMDLVVKNRPSGRMGKDVPKAA